MYWLRSISFDGGHNPHPPYRKQGREVASFAGWSCLRRYHKLVPESTGTSRLGSEGRSFSMVLRYGRFERIAFVRELLLSAACKG